MKKDEKNRTKKYTPRPVYIGPDKKFVSKENPPPGTKVYFNGKIITTIEDGQIPTRTQKVRYTPKSYEQWLAQREKSDTNIEYYNTRNGKRLIRERNRVPSSESETTAEFITAGGVYSGLRKKKQITYEADEYDENGNLKARPSPDEFSLKLYQANPYYTKEKQQQIIDEFDRANDAMRDWEQDFGIKIGKGFHLYQSDTPETVEKKLANAIEVQNADYLKQLALTYKLDFLSNFINHIPQEQYDELSKAIIQTDDLMFLRFLKSNQIDYLAYALDSIITHNQYEMIIDNVNFMIRNLKEIA